MGRWGEMNKKGEISPSDAERQFNAMISALGKSYFLLKKDVCHFFLWLDQLILAEPFLLQS